MRAMPATYLEGSLIGRIASLGTPCTVRGIVRSSASAHGMTPRQNIDRDRAGRPRTRPVAGQTTPGIGLLATHLQLAGGSSRPSVATMTVCSEGLHHRPRNMPRPAMCLAAPVLRAVQYCRDVDELADTEEN